MTRVDAGWSTADDGANCGYDLPLFQERWEVPYVSNQCHPMYSICRLTCRRRWALSFVAFSVNWTSRRCSRWAAIS